MFLGKGIRILNQRNEKKKLKKICLPSRVKGAQDRAGETPEEERQGTM